MQITGANLKPKCINCHRGINLHVADILFKYDSIVDTVNKYLLIEKDKIKIQKVLTPIYKSTRYCNLFKSD